MISKFFPWFGEAPRDPAARIFSHHGSCPVTLASLLFAKLMELFPTAGSLHSSLSLEHFPDTC